MKYKNINFKWIIFIFLVILAIAGPFALNRVYDDLNFYYAYLLSFFPATLFFILSIIMHEPIFVPKLGFLVPKEVKGNIRVSYSNLVRIKHKDNYLLVLGHNDRYQPPGGVYHYIGDYIERTFGFKRDSTGSDAKDIRGRININNLIAFMDWVKSRDEETREVTPDREFKEELIKSEILPEEIFADFNLKYEDTKYKEGKIAYSKHYQTYELIIFDIFVLYPNDKQRAFLDKLIDNQNSTEKYIFADKKAILRRGVSGKDFKDTITDHSQYILEDN